MSHWYGFTYCEVLALIYCCEFAGASIRVLFVMVDRVHSCDVDLGIAHDAKNIMQLL